MSWSRQHFELIAETVDNTFHGRQDYSGKKALCQNFSEKLRHKNDQFSHRRFMNACAGKNVYIQDREKTGSRPEHGDRYVLVEENWDGSVEDVDYADKPIKLQPALEERKD